MQLRILLTCLFLSLIALSYTTSSTIPAVDGLILVLAIFSMPEALPDSS